MNRKQFLSIVFRIFLISLIPSFLIFRKDNDKLRKIYLILGENEFRVPMKYLRKGDRFRMEEPDGSPIMLGDYEEMIAISDAKIISPCKLKNVIVTPIKNYGVDIDWVS